MTFDEARIELSNAVYKAALCIERFECEGLVFGNGHHAAQKIAAYAVGDLARRWKNRGEMPVVQWYM